MQVSVHLDMLLTCPEPCACTLHSSILGPICCRQHLNNATLHVLKTWTGAWRDQSSLRPLVQQPGCVGLRADTDAVQVCQS